MYRFKKCYILARTSLLLLPFRYAAAVLYNSNKMRERGEGLLYRWRRALQQCAGRDFVCWALFEKRGKGEPVQL